MIVRIIGISIGVATLLGILLLRGLPVMFFLKMIPLAILLIIATAFIYAGITRIETDYIFYGDI
jgi:hypothetical protein